MQDGPHILVVDDEELVREFSERALATGGFAVTLCEDGQSAIDAFRAAPDRFSAVVLDLNMPKLSGRATLEALRKLRTDLPVLIATGFSDDDVATLTADSHTESIQKPYGAATLIQNVRRLLVDP